MDSLEQQVMACKLEKVSSLSMGGIAQLGERLHGMQEVIGSIPFTSTIFWGLVSWGNSGGTVQVGKDVSPLRLEA